MGYTLIAFAVGVLIGYLRGGRLKHLAEHRFRFFPLLLAGIVLQTLGQSGFYEDGYPFILASYFFLLAFASLNIQIVGMLITAAGIAMNFLVIAVNEGMPISVHAAVTASDLSEKEIREIDFKAKRHLQRPDDKLMLLADVIPAPIPGYPQVLSAGDLVISMGLSTMMVYLMLPGPVRNKKEDDEEESEEPIDGEVII